jgi:hypothetical protein
MIHLLLAPELTHHAKEGDPENECDEYPLTPGETAVKFVDEHAEDPEEDDRILAVVKVIPELGGHAILSGKVPVGTVCEMAEQIREGKANDVPLPEAVNCEDPKDEGDKGDCIRRRPESLEGWGRDFCPVDEEVVQPVLVSPGNLAHPYWWAAIIESDSGSRIRSGVAPPIR